VPAKQGSPHHWQFSKAHNSPRFAWGLSKFHTFKISSQNYAGSKQKSYKIIITQMFTILDKAKPNTESIRGLNLAAVTPTIVQVSKLPL
jgi:hypothetical protein